MVYLQHQDFYLHIYHRENNLEGTKKELAHKNKARTLQLLNRLEAAIAHHRCACQKELTRERKRTERVYERTEK